MSLDIRVRTCGSQDEAGPLLSFDNDGYYWFLHPLFARLREQCGKYLDLYGDTQLTRDDYPRLRRLLDEADQMARRQPKTWKVHVGTQLRPTKQELYRNVNRDDLLKIIATMRSMIDTADKLGGYLECTGD